MKKTLVNLLSLMTLSSLFTFTSCQKEQMGNGTQFRATMEVCTSKDGKTTLNGNSLNWVEGDQIVVYGDAGCGLYTATPQTPATVAVFNNVSGETGDAPFHAYYPSTLTTDGVNITLPATQTYVEGSMDKFPMYAESANNQLSFRNLCGVLKLHLTKANTNISAITITTNTEANGTYNIDYNNGDPLLTLVGNGTNTTTLECTTAQSITNGKDFYIYLPATVDSVKSIMLTTDNGMICTKTVKASSHIGIDRNTITDVTLGENDLVFRPIGSKGGLFTINANGDQVWFSQGNLQYQASTDTWRFSLNQYDFVGDATYGNVYENGVKSNNEFVSDVYSGWIDLFDNFVDWGNNAISNGGNVANCGWRTLTSVEWQYIFNNHRYGTGNINGVHGVILLPSSWTLPAGCNSFNEGFGNGWTDWTHNGYTLAQWAAMESAGAVFLPAAGARLNVEVYDVSYYGVYFSSTYNNDEVEGVIFDGAGLDAMGGIGGGASVRLVRNSN